MGRPVRGDSVGQTPSVLDIRVLGRFGISVDGHALRHPAWRLRKAESLVKLLAATPGHRLHREQILEALWPDVNLRAATGAFYQTLHFARRALEAGLADARTSAYLSLTRNVLVLRASGRLSVDADEFDDAVRTARQTKSTAAYRRAADLYAGDLLPDDIYEDWPSTRRTQLRTTAVDLLLEWAQSSWTGGDSGAALDALQRASCIEPTNEHVHAFLMSTYALAGMHESALQQYRHLCDILAREIGARPDPGTRRLYDEIRAGRFPASDATVPAITVGRRLPSGGGTRRQPAARTNLPRQLSSFVGRSRELVDVTRLIERHPLVTLTGAGGSGKTRLVQEAGAGVLSRYSDGVWFVSLAALSEPSLVSKAIASTLGVHEQTHRPMLDTLREWLRDKHILLILDNVEHLITVCAAVADDLLKCCAHLQILATGRQSLRIPGEVAYPVGPLSLPPPGLAPSADALSGSEAAALFVDRAAAVLPSFRLTDENAGAILQICRRLDGMPLAIELAAARVRALSVHQIAARLDDQLALLEDRGRAGLPRHQTLTAAMNWSHELLSGAERALFRRLGAFAGGFTLDAAQRVGTDSGFDGASVIDLTGGLVLKSLVEVDELGSEVRYRLLEPVRQYALAKLAAAREGAEVRTRHCEFFLAAAERAHEGMAGPQRLVWFRRMETEHDNVRAALRWAMAEDCEQASRLGATMARFWARRSFLEEGVRWLEELRRHELRVSERTRAEVWLGLALLAFELGEHAQAMIANRALEVFRRIGDGERVEQCLSLLGMTENERGRFDCAVTLLDEAVCLAAAAGSPAREAERLRQRGYIEVRRGTYRAAVPYLSRSLELLRGTGARRSVGFGLGHLAQVYLYEGQFDQAIAGLREAIALVEAEEHSTAIAYFHNLLGLAFLKTDELEAAVRTYSKNLVYSAQVGHCWAAAQALIGIAEIDAVRGEPDRAVRLVAAADAVLKTTDYLLPLAETDYLGVLTDRLRASLGPGRFELGRAGGASLTLNEAIEEALAPAVAPS